MRKRGTRSLRPISPTRRRHPVRSRRSSFAYQWLLQNDVMVSHPVFLVDLDCFAGVRNDWISIERSSSLKADLPDGQISPRAFSPRLSSPSTKKFSLHDEVETALSIRLVPPQQEGRIAIVTRRGARDAMDA